MSKSLTDMLSRKYCESYSKITDVFFSLTSSLFYSLSLLEMNLKNVTIFIIFITGLFLMVKIKLNEEGKIN